MYLLYIYIIYYQSSELPAPSSRYAFYPPFGVLSLSARHRRQLFRTLLFSPVFSLGKRFGTVFRTFRTLLELCPNFAFLVRVASQTLTPAHLASGAGATSVTALEFTSEAMADYAAIHGKGTPKAADKSSTAQTAESIAIEHNVNEKTVRRAGKFAESVEKAKAIVTASCLLKTRYCDKYSKACVVE